MQLDPRLLLTLALSAGPWLDATTATARADDRPVPAIDHARSAPKPAAARASLGESAPEPEPTPVDDPCPPCGRG